MAQSSECEVEVSLDLTNEDGLRIMVTNERQARVLHMVRKRRE